MQLAHSGVVGRRRIAGRDVSRAAARTSGRSALFVRVAQNGVLALLSIVVTLALFEAALRLLGYQAIYDTYSKPSQFWKHDAVLGWSHEPNVEGTFVGPRPWPVEFSSEVATNSLGLRGPELRPVPPGGYRVMVLGDSVVAGFEVPYEQTFTALLEAELSARLDAPVQVINAGVRGYGTDQSYLFYRERGIELDPDLVVLFHSNNDTRNNMTLHRMRRVFGKPAFLLQDDGGLEPVAATTDYPVCSQVQVSPDATVVRADGRLSRAFCGLQMALFDHSALFSFLTLRLRNNPDLLASLYSLGSGGPVATKVAASRADSASYPGRLTAAIIGELSEAVASTDAGFVLVGVEDGIGMIDHEGLEAVGVTPYAVAPMGREYSFENDSHYNADGHREAAERFAPIVAQRLRDVSIARQLRRASPSEVLVTAGL